MCVPEALQACVLVCYIPSPGYPLVPVWKSSVSQQQSINVYVGIRKLLSTAALRKA